MSATIPPLLRGEGPKTLDELTAALGVNRALVRLSVNSLVAAEYLESDDGETYRLSPTGRRILQEAAS